MLREKKRKRKERLKDLLGSDAVTMAVPAKSQDP